jgi:hypothetical protein
VRKTDTKYTRKDLDTVKGTALPVDVIERVAEERLSLSLNLVNRCRLVSA